MHACMVVQMVRGIQNEESVVIILIIFDLLTPSNTMKMKLSSDILSTQSKSIDNHHLRRLPLPLCLCLFLFLLIDHN